MNQTSEHKGGKRLQKASPRPKGSGGGGRDNKPRREGKDLIRHRIFVALTVIAAIIVVAFLFWNIFSAPPEVGGGVRDPETTTILDENGNEVVVELPPVSADRKKHFYTFLLVGQDTFGGGNTDTMMLGAYNVPEQTLSVMSLPRDTYVEYNGRKVLLNSVFNRAGGMKEDKGITALKKAVGELTGVTPDYHIIVQWAAVGKLVDAIDGVDFDVPRRMYYNDLSQDFKIDLQPGMQHMTGAKAMQLIRWRHNSDDNGNILNSGYANGDLGRINTQQDFMKAVIAKCLRPDVLLPNLAEYIQIFQENVMTNLTISNMTYFGKSAVAGLNMENVNFVTMPWKNAGDGAHILPVKDELLAMVNESFNPYKEDLLPSELKVVGSLSGTSNSSKPSATPKPKPAESEAPVTSEPPEESPEPSASTKPEPSAKPNGEDPLLPPGTTDKPSETEKPGGEPKETVQPTPAPVESEKPQPTPEPKPEPTPAPPAEEEPLLPPGA